VRDYFIVIVKMEYVIIYKKKMIIKIPILIHEFIFTGMSVFMPIQVTPLCPYPVNSADVSSGASLTVIINN
jgi:hypothetical protein